MFGQWYDDVRARLLEPALAVAHGSLTRALSELLSDRDLSRIRSTTGRVKSKRRTWRKIHSPRYEGQIATVDDIAGTIDDLVGLRVTCINLRDVDTIQTALEALAQVPGRGLWLDPATARDYVADPKPSGYRGWHVNLGVLVGEAPVVCELQVRTLLQDSWGELTHEETYSKEGALPPLVEVLSTRMADLLAILDEIGEDLRTELDRLDQEAVAGSDDGDVDAAILAGQSADAADLLRGRWASITRPVDLATLAWALQREFGAEISDDWFGHGSFKRFLRHAVPDGEISTGRQAYLLPMDSGPAQGSTGGADPDVGSDPYGDDAPDRAGRPTAPGAARQLRRIDPQFPLLAGADWPLLFEHLAESWQRVKPTDATVGSINRLTRSARDLARGAGVSRSRRTLDYVVKALLATEETSPVGQSPWNSNDIAHLFATNTLERMVELRILDDTTSKAARRVKQWITQSIDP